MDKPNAKLEIMRDKTVFPTNVFIFCIIYVSTYTFALMCLHMSYLYMLYIHLLKPLETV